MKYIKFNFDDSIWVDRSDFIDTLCNVHSVSKEDLMGRSRKGDVMTAKASGVYLLREHTNLPYKAIGEIFGDLEHSNSIHHYKTVAFQLSHKSGKQYKISMIKNELIYGSYKLSRDETMLSTLVRLSISWGKARDLTDVKAQSMKLSEEVGELMAGILKQDIAKQVDSIGDIMVVLSILSDQLGIDLQEAFQSAYDTIATRTGNTVNGSFIKDEDA